MFEENATAEANNRSSAAVDSSEDLNDKRNEKYQFSFIIGAVSALVSLTFVAALVSGLFLAGTFIFNIGIVAAVGAGIGALILFGSGIKDFLSASNEENKTTKRTNQVNNKNADAAAITDAHAHEASISNKIDKSIDFALDTILNDSMPNLEDEEAKKRAKGQIKKYLVGENRKKIVNAIQKGESVIGAIQTIASEQGNDILDVSNLYKLASKLTASRKAYLEKDAKTLTAAKKREQIADYTKMENLYLHKGRIESDSEVKPYNNLNTVNNQTAIKAGGGDK